MVPLDSINSSSCHSSFPRWAPLASHSQASMILDEQSQKQNVLEPPRWEQMARNCLAEEARESIFLPVPRELQLQIQKKRGERKKVQVRLF